MNQQQQQIIDVSILPVIHVNADDPFSQSSKLIMKQKELAEDNVISKKGKTVERCKKSATIRNSWTVRYKELVEYVKEHGHAAIPYKYEKNQKLAFWAKRQRMQYKYWTDGHPTKITKEKIDLLDSIGFVWNLHEVSWMTKLNELLQFRKKYNHCNVPISYKANPKLSVWVKCQRRQYNLFWDGKKSAMTPERIVLLEKIGFEWRGITGGSKWKE